MKIGKYNVGLGYNKEKPGKNKWSNGDHNNNNKENNNYNNSNSGGGGDNIREDNNKNKWEGRNREIRL